MLLSRLVRIILLLSTANTLEVQLRKRSTIYLPYDYLQNGDPKTELFKHAADNLAFDPENMMIYVEGEMILHAVDVSNPDNMTVKSHIQYPDMELTDVEFCGGFVFATLDNKTVRADGKVIVFSAYNGTDGSFVELMQIPVGVVPDMVKPTRDCSKLVVAVEGEAYELPANQITDPPGKITIITFPGGVNTNYIVTPLGFDEYNDRVDELSESGVRHVYRENGNPFSNDLEPEYIAFNSDDTIAYVTLQENNAIAVVDLMQKNITKIHGLGFKNWTMHSIDPSDKDRGAFMYPYHIRGIYCPDAISHFTFKGDNYVVTANEGDSKDYEFGSYEWTEEVRGEDISDEMMAALDAETVDQLSRETLLGRMKFAASPAEKDSSGRLKALYSYGGRSFTIRRADDMSVVFDSGDDISRQIYKYNSALFNSHVGDKSNRPFEDVDLRSDDKGAEPEMIAVGEVKGTTLLFVGNERSSTILVYSLDSDIRKPVFQDIYVGIPDVRSKTWEGLFEERKLSEIDPEDLLFVPASKSPTRKPILFASGSISGTISIIDVIVTESPSPPPTGTPCPSAATRDKIESLVAMVTMMLAVLLSGQVE